MSTSHYWRLGNQLTYHDDSRSKEIDRQRFREFFGISPEFCVQSCGMSCTIQIPYQYIWTASSSIVGTAFWKRDFTEHVMSAEIGHDEKTIRKWVWIFFYLLSMNLTPVIYLNL